MRRQTRCRGFTLIELLIVVAIIAILALIAVPNFLEAQARAKVSREKNDLRNLAVAIESYCVDNQSQYPPMTDRTGRYAYPSSVRFTWITTPVAYITSVQRDPFVTDLAESDKTLGNLEQKWVMDTYGYARPDTTCNGTYYEDWFVFGHAWRCHGAGPAGVNEWDQSGPNPGLPWSLDFPNYLYDPTNGTVSFGFVVRVGPCCPTKSRGHDDICRLTQ
jgi:prepilin-type N-terminal cleavage/methylation domain-containing protein